MTRCNPWGTKTKTEQWHCQNRRTGRRRPRAEATDGLIWSVELRKGGGGGEATAERFVLMPARQERRAELAAILKNKHRQKQKERSPWRSGTVQVRGTEASDKRESKSPFASVWICGWYVCLFIYLFHTCTHSQFRDAQVLQSQRPCLFFFFFCFVCLFSRQSCNAQKPLLQSVVSHCSFFSRCEKKSVMDFQFPENHTLK